MTRTGNITPALDLWTPVLPDDQQHNNFRVALHYSSQEARDEVSRWAEGLFDRDGKFVHEFQTTFDSCFWELYLHAAFRELGFTCSFAHAAPDFHLRRENASVIAEAVVAGNASGYWPEWQKLRFMRENQTFDLHQALRYTTVRLANTFTAKARKYQESYSTYDHVRGHPYVICIVPFDHPGSLDWAQHAMRRVLYGQDQPIFDRDSETGEAHVFGVSEVESVTKDTGVEIPLGYFRDGAFSHVSAVIFSNTATLTKAKLLSADPMTNTFVRAERYNSVGTMPLVTVAQKPEYAESLLDGLLLSLNPFAEHPLDPRSFQNREIAIESWDPHRQQYWHDTPHEWLIRRMAITLRPSADMAPPVVEPGPPYKSVARPAWPEGELRPVPAVMYPCVDNHLAHVDGWTVAVFRDAIDDTWHATAIQMIVHTIPEFRAGNARDDVPTICFFDDHESRQLAFDAIKAAIAKASRE